MFHGSENRVHPRSAQSAPPIHINGRPANAPQNDGTVLVSLEDTGGTYETPDNHAEIEDTALTDAPSKEAPEPPFQPQRQTLQPSRPSRPTSTLSRPVSSRSRHSMASRPMSTRSGFTSRPLSVSHINPEKTGTPLPPATPQTRRLHSASSRRSRLEVEDDVKSVRSMRLAEQGVHGKEQQARRIKDDTLQSNEKYEENRRYIEYIHMHFSCKECVNFCPTNLNQVKYMGAKPKCACGEYEDFHSPGTKHAPEDYEWDRNHDVEEFRPTNAFGRIEFINDDIGNKVMSEYVRMADSNSLDSVIDLMVGHWGLLEKSRPSLCISVIGGAKDFKLQDRKLHIFSDGLMKAAESTDAWIITSGLNIGINKIVGDAVEANRGKAGSKGRMRCLGVAPWGYVLNREDLVSEGCTGLNPALYRISSAICQGEPVSLNASHSHFVLVDDGTRNRYSGTRTQEFRGALERKIALSEVVVEGESGLGVPLVKVIVEGGYEVFVDACNAIRHRVPIVVCDGTGRAADILAYAARKMRSVRRDQSGLRVMPERYREELVRRFTEALGASLDEGSQRHAVRMADMCSEILQEDSLVTIFDLTRAEGFDRAILHALMKSQRDRDGDEAYLQQLRLALTWDRADVARDKIFRENINIEPEVLEEMMWYSILEEKLDFVKLLLQNGVSMRDFLTVARLRQFYDCAPQKCLFRSVMRAVVPNANTYCLVHIRKLVRCLVGSYHNAIYMSDNDVSYKPGLNRFENQPNSNIDFQHFDRPFNELFLWALLTKRQSLALFFWERTDTSLTHALMATKIYHSLHKWIPSNDYSTRAEYLRCKDEFEAIADRLVSKCYEVDNEKTSLLIERHVHSLGGRSCLELGGDAVDRRFVANRICQTSIGFIWNKGMLGSGMAFLCAYLLPPLILLNSVIRFQDPLTSDGSEEVGACDKLFIFYSSPRVKFIGNFLAWIIFLGFFSAHILFGMEPALTVLEVVIVIYMIIFLFDGIREVMVASRLMPRGRYATAPALTPWMWVTALTVALTLATLIVRVVTGISGVGYVAAKTMYTTTGVFYFIRVIRFLSAIRMIGSKLVLIHKMLREFLIYVTILFVALVAYGVTSQALLFPTRPWKNFILRDVFAIPYWQIFGEVYQEQAMAVKLGCTGNRIFASDGRLCPTYHFMVPLLLAIYLIVANILFLNLLIAMFVHVYREAQADSQILWKFAWFFRVKEFERCPVLPFPFSIIEDFLFFFSAGGSCVRKRRDKMAKEAMLFVDPLELELRVFQQDVLRMYLASIRVEAETSVAGRISSLDRRIAELHRVVEEERLFTLKAYGYGREVTVYERPQSADSRPNSAGSDGQRIIGRYSRPKRRGPRSWSTIRDAKSVATSDWELGTTSSLDEAPVLPGYLVYEQLQALASQSAPNSAVANGEGEMKGKRRRVSLMDERLADLEDTTSKSLLGIESLVRGIIEEDSNQMSVSSYSSSVDSYPASDEEGESRVVRRHRYHHHHETDERREKSETLSSDRSEGPQEAPHGPPQEASHGPPQEASQPVESEIEAVQKSARQ